MAKTTLSTIKSWFVKGAYPTQPQFWNVFDSFFHKDEKLQVSDVESLNKYLNQKAEKQTLNNHLNSETAHQSLFNQKQNKEDGKGLSEANFTLAEKEKLLKYDHNHYAAPVEDLTALAAIGDNIRSNGQRRFVSSEGIDYFYNSNLLAADASEADVAPDDQEDNIGFWVKSKNTANIKIKDSNGIYQFNIEETVQFSGFTFDSAKKQISASALVPFTVFVDTISGSDGLGELENIKRPYKTHKAAFESIPDDGNFWTMHFIDGNVTRTLTEKVSGYKLFTTASGVFDLTSIPTESPGKIDIEVPNATVLFAGDPKYIGNNSGNYSTTHFIAKKLIVNTTTPVGHHGVFKNSPANSNFSQIKIGTVEGNADTYLTSGLNSEIEIDEYIFNENTNPIGGGVTCEELIIKKIIINTPDATLFPTTAWPKILKINEISGQGNLYIGGTDTNYTTFCNNLKVAETVNFYPFGGGTGAWLEGNISSKNNNVFLSENSASCNIRVRNFIGYVVGSSRLFATSPSQSNRGIVHLINTTINVKNNFIKVDGGVEASNKFVLSFVIEGNCSIFSEENSEQMILGQGSDYILSIDLKGSFKTNFKTVGKNVNLNYLSNTYKEKQKEIIVRSKHDIINQELEPGVTYIIDGDIALGSDEHIIVPEGGITLNGYSFDSSRLGSYGIPYHDLFITKLSTEISDIHAGNDGNSFNRIDYEQEGLNQGKKSVLLNGYNNRIELNFPSHGFNSFYTNPNNIPASPFSLGLWFKPKNNTNGGCTLIGIGLRTSRENLRLYLDSSNNLAINQGSNTSEIISANISEDWHFIELKWDGSQLVSFLDGQETILGANTDTTNWNHNGDRIELGRMMDGGYYEGFIDRFFVYSRARSTEESNATYNSGNGLFYVDEVKTGLISYYDMNDVPTGGSGNIILNNIAFTVTGKNAGVFDVKDVDKNQAIELNDVNFEGCKSLGRLKDYRQFTATTVGIYDCYDGFQLLGAWNGFKITNSNCFGFAETGTLFKRGKGLLFHDRFYMDMNIDVPTGAILADFLDNDFESDDLFQINNSRIKMDGVADIANTSVLIPNIDSNSVKARWSNSIGIQLSAVTFYDMKSPNGNIYRLKITDQQELSITPL